MIAETHIEKSNKQRKYKIIVRFTKKGLNGKKKYKLEIGQSQYRGK